MTEETPRRYIQGFEIDEKGVVVVPSGALPYVEVAAKNDEEEGSDA